MLIKQKDSIGQQIDQLELLQKGNLSAVQKKLVTTEIKILMSGVKGANAGNKFLDCSTFQSVGLHKPFN